MEVIQPVCRRCGNVTCFEYIGDGKAICCNCGAVVNCEEDVL